MLPSTGKRCPWVFFFFSSRRRHTICSRDWSSGRVLFRSLALVQSFFRDYLGSVRGASAHTIRAYRDALKLFFLFLADRKRRSITELSLNDIQAEAVLSFLDRKSVV